MINTAARFVRAHLDHWVKRNDTYIALTPCFKLRIFVTLSCLNLVKVYINFL